LTAAASGAAAPSAGRRGRLLAGVRHLLDAKRREQNRKQNRQTEQPLRIRNVAQEAGEIADHADGAADHQEDGAALRPKHALDQLACLHHRPRGQTAGAMSLPARRLSTLETPGG